MDDKELEKISGVDNIGAKMLKARKNGLLLTDEQVDVLSRHNIDINKAGSTEELLYMIDNYDDDEYDDSELDQIAQVLQERKYYEKTNK
jgi:hypothetical protein